MSASSLEHRARWSKPAAMPRSQTRPEPQRTTAVEIGLGHDQIMVFREEAARRSTTVPRLIHDLLDVIATDQLTTAILDD
jgi:hypothetical protein